MRFELLGKEGAPSLMLIPGLWGPLRYYQSYNVWTCYHWTGFWRRVFLALFRRAAGRMPEG